MDDLPDDILRRIFEFLPLKERLRLEQVCKRWSILMPYYVTKLDFVETFFSKECQQRADTFPLTNVFCSLLKRCGIHLKEISFGDIYLLVTFIIIDRIDEFCPNLEILDLSYSTVTETVVTSLMSLTDRLIELNFANTVFSIRNVDQHKDNMAIFFSNCEKLQKINMQKTSIDNLTSVYFLPPTLISLNLNSCSPLRMDVLIDVLARCQDLEELRLSAYIQLNQLVLETICSLKRLKILELSHMAFGEIVFHTDQEEPLNFSIVRELKNLEELYVQYNNQINDHVFAEICGKCSKLKKLNISYCRNLRLCYPIGWLHNLSELYIAASTVADEDLEPLIKKGTLSVLHATSCCCLTDKTLINLINFCYQKLTHLTLNQCCTLLNETVELMFQKCHLLKYASLHGSELDNGVFNGLFFGKDSDQILFPQNLTILDFSYCGKMDEKAVINLNEYLTLRNANNRRKITLYLHQTKVAKNVVTLISPNLLELKF